MSEHKPNKALQLAMGKALTKEMAHYRVTCEELAAKTGAGAKNISQIRNGRNCSLNMWFALCDGLGVRFSRIARAAEKIMEGDK